MKKLLCLGISLLLLFTLLAGCDSENPDELSSGNDILSYRPIDADKTQLIVSRTGNLEVLPFIDEFERLNPDIQVILVDITGGDSKVNPSNDWLKHGYATDIVLTTIRFADSEQIDEYFTDLSAKPYVSSFNAEALRDTAVNGCIYMLPGPSNVNCLVYNKTLFAEYGWTLPTSFDEFVELCATITRDTDGTIEPWNPNAKYTNELNIVLEAFAYEELFGGSANRTWLNEFLAGNAVFSEHMAPFFDMADKLVENGIIREEHFSYSATTRGKEFLDGKIAMINSTISKFENGEYDFGYAPFPATMGDIGYVCGFYSCFVGVPKKERSAKTEAAVERFCEYFSSPEGQEAFIGNSMQLSSVEGVELKASADLAALQPVIDAGHMFSMIEFGGTLGSGTFSPHSALKKMMDPSFDRGTYLKSIDTTPFVPRTDNAQQEPEVLAVAEEDFSILETSRLIADAYRETMDAEVGLIATTSAYRGNLMRMFKGDITSDFVNVLLPRSLENGSKLVKVTMTGEQLLSALNTPPNYNDEVANCVYACSSLECVIAPRNELGTKYLSVKLVGGAEIEADRLYTVALWEGSVGAEFISAVLESYEGSWQDMMSAWLRSKGSVRPVSDGSIKLVWE